MSLRLILDLDGCLSNFNHGYREMLASVAGQTNEIPSLDEPETWEYASSLGYTPEQEAEAWRRINADPHFWATLDPYPGAVTFLDWLWRSLADANWTQHQSHEVYFLTSRVGTRAKDQTEIWLRRHGFSGMPPTVLVTRGDKGRIAADLGATHVIDDKAENVLSIKKFRPSATVCLLSAAWNREHHDTIRFADIQILDSLKDFQALIASEV